MSSELRVSELIEGRCECLAYGKQYYVNGEGVVLCEEHLKLFKDVHGKDLKTKQQHIDDLLGAPFSKLAAAMAAPLKINLDYRVMADLIQVETMPMTGYPVYDVDLPEPEGGKSGKML